MRLRATLRPRQVNVLVSGPSQRKSKVGMRQKIKIKICDFSKLYSKFPELYSKLPKLYSKYPKMYSTAAFINKDGKNI